MDQRSTRKHVIAWIELSEKRNRCLCSGKLDQSRRAPSTEHCPMHFPEKILNQTNDIGH